MDGTSKAVREFQGSHCGPLWLGVPLPAQALGFAGSLGRRPAAQELGALWRVAWLGAPGSRLWVVGGQRAKRPGSLAPFPVPRHSLSTDSLQDSLHMKEVLTESCLLAF